ncbi:MAG: hypothetical protein LBQ91_02500 [Oscillospiraceae bacterium]|jgi:shikimate dehydrogenase|nr:hypothetical protein [Oscillospiraceae bacterium]
MRFGLVGANLSYSHSKKIHEALFGYEYEMRSLDEAGFDALLASRDFDGLNVTIPYKTRVLRFLDRVSPEAEKIGCVNTVVREKDGALSGYNTDLAGFLYMLRRAGIDPVGKKTLILGSGATSKTARAALTSLGAGELVNISRSGEDNYGNLRRHRDAEIIVNTTPVGTYPNCRDKLIKLADFPQLTAVADVVYNPLKTALLLEAEALGITHTNGLPMLVAQAAFAGELFTGPRLPDDRLEQVLTELTQSLKNIVLVGMPGSGKTTVGRLISDFSGRAFYDTDDEVVKSAGMSIPEFFAKHSEREFRDMESETAERLLTQNGLVVSTGGGAVLRRENLDAMRRNGFVVWIKRAVAQLATQGRPLSTNAAALEKMLSVRMPYYELVSDAVIENENAEESAREIWRLFNEKA